MSDPVFSIQLHITEECSQRCKHCYIYGQGAKRASQSVMSYEMCTTVIDDLVESCRKLEAKPRVSLTGGDPLLHPRFWEVLAYAKSRDVRVAVLGNPFLIDNETAKRLKDASILCYQLSLDGMPQKHDKWRKRGSFSATVRAIEILKRADIKTTVMSTVSKDNAEDIPRLTRQIVELGVDTFAFARFCPTVPDGDVAADVFTPDEYRQFLEKMWRVFTELSDGPTSFVLKDHLWLLYLTEIGLFKPDYTIDVAVSGCGLGISHLTVLPDGSVFACRRFESRVGQLPQNSLYDVFAGEALENYRDWNKLEKCADCELLHYCRGCMAVAYCQTGRWTAADPQCWK